MNQKKKTKQTKQTKQPNTEHPLCDVVYKRLGVTLDVIPSTSPEFSMISKYSEGKAGIKHLFKVDRWRETIDFENQIQKRSRVAV